MAIIMAICGYIIGKKSNNKGYCKGLLVGIIFISFIFIISLFLKSTYNIHTLIYYIVLVLCSVIGSMIGIQKNSLMK